MIRAQETVRILTESNPIGSQGKLHTWLHLARIEITNKYNTK